jgi:hypothetical protein
MLRRLMLVLILLVIAGAQPGCQSDRRIIDKHEQALQEEDE